MSKKVKKAQNRKQPASGSNRQQRRAQERMPQRTGTKSSKPLALRILIIVMFLAILIGFCLAPLLKTI